MKKRFGIYAAAWAVLLVLFNVIAFVSAGWEGREKYTPSFWIGYALISVMFLGQLACAYYVLKENDLKKLFYRISLFGISFAGMIASFVVGGLCMLIPPLPYWVGAIFCAVVLAANFLLVIKTVLASSAAEHVDEIVNESTRFIKALTVDAQRLMARADAQAVKDECRKIYEALRYSDPVSARELQGIEEQIRERFTAFSLVVSQNDRVQAKTISEELLALIGERNSKCSLLK